MSEMERADKTANRVYSDAHRVDDRRRFQVEASKRHSTRFVVDWITGHLDAGARVLDIAGGAGSYASALVRSKQLEVVGVDISPELVRKRDCDALLTENVVGDMESLPFAAESFDAAMFIACLHHVPDPAPSLLEAFRVLRPGGQLFAFEPSSLRAGPSGTSPIEGYPHEFRLSGKALAHKVAAAGFDVEERRGYRITARFIRRVWPQPIYVALRACDLLDRALSLAPAVEQLGEVVAIRARKRGVD